MVVHRSLVKAGQRLVYARSCLEARVLSRTMYSTAAKPFFKFTQTSNHQLFPAQTGCISQQVRYYTDEKCTEHGKSDCKKCNKEVSLDELAQLINDSEDLKLVDVRESYELREAGAIPKAINIPLTQLKSTFLLECDQFKSRLGLSKPTKSDKNIVFYGLGGNRSVAALEIACKMGYKKPVLEQLKEEEFEKIFKTKKPRKDEEIIFSCAAGKRSALAMHIAEELGYTKARHYPGGWQEWSRSQSTHR